MKTAGTVFTGRAWCSWGCWTAAVLDFLPYKKNTRWKGKDLSRVRYLHLGISAVIVAVLFFVFGYSVTEGPAELQKAAVADNDVLYWFITGNALYYTAAVFLAVRMKDNRAFCKYLCPVAVMLKLSAVVSLLRIEGRKAECSGCGKCEQNCPASIKVKSYIDAGERVASTECIMCLNCVSVCPEGNLKCSIGVDTALTEKLKMDMA
jgi:polyferredoxin